MMSVIAPNTRIMIVENVDYITTTQEVSILTLGVLVVHVKLMLRTKLLIFWF